MNDSIAEAYFEAARAGADMRQATTALEAIRDALNSKDEVVTISTVFDEQIGRGDRERFLPTLVKLRDQFETKATAEAVEKLNAAFQKNREEGWRLWLLTYSRTFDDRSWWSSFAAEIAANALPWSPLPEWPVERIRQSAQKAFRGRWSDTYDWFLLLADQDLPHQDRAMFLSIAAQIQLYHFLRPTKAKELLERADSMAASNTSVLRTWGDYWLQVENVDEARKCFDQLIRDRPDVAGGFIGLGDCYDKSNDPSTAEIYYEQAIANAPGMQDGYLRLLSWHGKTEWFKTRETLLDPIIKRILALADYKPSAWLDVAFIYKQNSRFDQAREVLMKSVDLDPGYTLGHTWLGYTWLDEAFVAKSDKENAEKSGDLSKTEELTIKTADLLNKAELSIKQTIALEPESLDGYWAMSAIAIERMDWEAGLNWCDRGLGCHPEWESFVRVRRADMLRQLGRLEEAEQDLIRSIDLEPVNPAAADGLSEVAFAFEARNDYDAAFKTLTRWREVKGESSEYLFRNRVGNLRYRAEDYAAAAESYRLALAAAPNDDVIHSNLALALENLHQAGRRMEELEEAVAALRQALELQSGNTEYEKRLENLEAERKFVEAYGEEALKLESNISAIRVEVLESLFPDLLNESWELLSKETLAKAEAMRTRIQEQYGLTIPAINFGVLTYYFGSPEYTIRIMERDEYRGSLKPGGKFAPFEDVLLDQPSAPNGTWLEDGAQPAGSKEIWMVNDYILHHVQNVAEHHLSEFVGHQETFSYLQNSGLNEAKAILEKPEELTRTVLVLRGLLGKRVSIGSAELIIKEFTRMRESGSDVNAIVESLIATLNDGAVPSEASA